MGQEFRARTRGAIGSDLLLNHWSTVEMNVKVNAKVNVKVKTINIVRNGKSESYVMVRNDDDEFALGPW